MAIADELIAILGFDLKGEDQARKYNSILTGLAASAGAVSGMIVKMGIAAQGVAVTGMGFLARSVINTNAQFETYAATLETIEGSSEKARASLDWIAKFAKDTPYEMAEITEAFVKLKAYGIDPIADDALRVLGDTGAAMGKSLDQAVEAFADAATGEFERLKEFGIRAASEGDNVTFRWTKNGQDMTRTVKKSSAEIRAFLLETMGDRFTGAMDKQSKTWNGLMSKLGDTWQDFQKRIGERGFFESTKTKLEGLFGVLDRLDADGTLDRWAQTISDNLTWASDIAWRVLTRIAENARYLAESWDALKGPVMTVAGVLGVLFARAFPVVTVMTALAFAVDDLFAYLQGGESIIGDFIDWIKELTGVSDTVAEALAGLGGVVSAALAAAFFFAPIAFTKMFGTVMVAGLTSAFGLIITAMETGITAALFLLTNPVGWAILLAGAAAGLIWYFWDDLVAAWNDLAPRAKAMFTEMVDWFLAIDWLGTGAANMNAIWEGMKGIGASIKDWFSGLFALPSWLGGGEAAPSGGPLFTPSHSTLPTFGGGNPDQAADEIRRYLENINGNLSRVSPDRATDATITDSRQDNRQFPMTNNVTVNQTVTQPSDAPGQAAQATGAAVSGAIAGQRSQIEQEPAF